MKEELDFLVRGDWINLREDRNKNYRKETKAISDTIEKDMATSYISIERSFVHDSRTQNSRIPRKKKSTQSLLRGGSTPISTSISSSIEGNTIISKIPAIHVSADIINQSHDKHSASRQSFAIDELPSMVRLIIKNLISSSYLDYFPSIETCKLLTNLSTSDALGGLMEFQRGRPVNNKEEHLKSVLEKFSVKNK